MSELESLTSHATELSSKVDFWNNAVLWALLVTALAASAIVVSQRLAFLRAKELSEVQDRIARIKESSVEQANIKLRTDLASKQLELQKYIDFVESRQHLPGIPEALANSILRKAPPKKAIVLYLDGPPTTFLFASGIRSVLIRAGWQVPQNPIPVTSLVGLSESNPSTLRGEIIVLMKHPEREKDESTSEGALKRSISSILPSGDFGVIRDLTLPEDTFKIYIGPAN